MAADINSENKFSVKSKFEAICKFISPEIFALYGV